MKQYQQEAIDLLHTCPDTPERRAMEELVRFVIERKH
jgi:geranylgeranyl pyrophosphate synthase